MTGWTANEPTTPVALWITVEDVVEIGPSNDGTDVEYHLTHRSCTDRVERLRCLGATVITSVERADRWHGRRVHGTARGTST